MPAPIRRSLTASLRAKARASAHRGKRDRALDDGKPDEVGGKRRALGAVDRFSERVAVDQADQHEQRQRAGERQIAAAQQDRAEDDDRQRDQDFIGRHGDRLQVDGDAAHHRRDESHRQRRAGAMGGGKTADRDHRGEMVDADHRMAEPGQDALAEGRRHFATHQVMRECGLGQRGHGGWDQHQGQWAFHGSSSGGRH